MRVLLVEDRLDKRDALLRALDAPGVAVEVVSKSDAAAAIKREVPEAVVVGWPASGGSLLLQGLQIADAAHAIHMVAVIGEERPARDIQLALAAGANDFVRAPISAEELRARLDPGPRFRQWAKPMSSAVPKPIVRDLRAWQYLGDVVAEDLERTIQRSLAVKECRSLRASGRVRAGTINISLVKELSEVHVSLIVDETAAAALSEALLGDPHADEAAVTDMMRELANAAGGAFKRAALPENAFVTIGLPSDELLVVAPANRPRFWELSIADTGAVLSIVAEACTRPNVRLRAVELREGMVVVGDVRNRAGMLVITGGTRLTATSAARVATMLGSMVVEVANAA